MAGAKPKAAPHNWPPKLTRRRLFRHTIARDVFTAGMGPARQLDGMELGTEPL